MVQEAGTTGLSSSSESGEISHSLPVVLWGRDLIVSGTEEGGGMLYQVPGEEAEVSLIYWFINQGQYRLIKI